MVMIHLPPKVDGIVNWYIIYELFSTIFDRVLIEVAIIAIIHLANIYWLLLDVRHYFRCWSYTKNETISLLL